MLTTSLKIAWRPVRKRPGYSLIDVVGLACARLIGTYGHHEYARRVFRHGDERLSSDKVPLVSSTVFEVVDSLTLLRGAPGTALTEPVTVVVAESFARRLDAHPMRQALTVDSGSEVTIVDVVADPPAASHLALEALVTLQAPDDQEDWQERLESWGGINVITHLLLDNTVAGAADRTTRNARLADVLRASGVCENYAVATQPLHDVHLGSSDVTYDLTRGTSGACCVNALATVAVLLIAAFTAQQNTREIDIREVLDAAVPQIMVVLARDFAALGVLAVAIAIPLIYVVMRGRLTAFAYRVDLGASVFFIAAALALGVALLTLSYQSIWAAATDPMNALRYQ